MSRTGNVTIEHAAKAREIYEAALSAKKLAQAIAARSKIGSGGMSEPAKYTYVDYSGPSPVWTYEEVTVYPDRPIRRPTKPEKESSNIFVEYMEVREGVERIAIYGLGVFTGACAMAVTLWRLLT